jgi:prepilin-type N-terminal cleavage/methylation domain-containing protein
MQHPHERHRHAGGFSLLEFLVVTVVLAIMVAALVPLAMETVQKARIRTMANQFALDLRAARWTAVSSRAPVSLSVAVDPSNVYEYTDARGKVRKITMPVGVRIVSSTNPIQFLANGSVPGGASTIIESQITDDAVSRFTVSTSSLGISKTTHQRVSL